MTRLAYGIVAVAGVVAVIGSKWFAKVFTATNLSSEPTGSGYRRHRIMAGYARTIAVLVGGLLCVAGILGAAGIHR